MSKDGVGSRDGVATRMPEGCHKDHAEPILREIRGRHEVDGVEMGVGLLVQGGRLVRGVCVYSSTVQ